MSRVLFLVNHDVVIYNFRLELVERLLEEGHEVYVSSPLGAHTEELKRIGVKFYEISFDRHGMNPIDEIRLLFCYNRLIREVKPDIIFTYTIKCNIYGGISSRIQHVPFCANVTGLGTTINYGGIRKRVALALYKFGLRSAQRVFFQNENNKQFMVDNRIVFSPYTVLPGSGVNLERHSFEPYPESQNPIIISYIGRIMKDKGIDELLEVASVIKTQNPNVIFRLIGFFDDNYYSRIIEAQRAGVIEYVEQQSNIHPWIAGSHAVILPSYHEGMSNVLLEAASTGRPILASAIPGCRETFEEGKSGIGFKPHDCDDLLRALREFIDLPYEKKIQMGKAGRRKVEQEFDRTIIVKEYMKEMELLK